MAGHKVCNTTKLIIKQKHAHAVVITLTERNNSSTGIAYLQTPVNATYWTELEIHDTYRTGLEIRAPYLIGRAQNMMYNGTIRVIH